MLRSEEVVPIYMCSVCMDVYRKVRVSKQGISWVKSGREKRGDQQGGIVMGKKNGGSFTVNKEPGKEMLYVYGRGST